MSGFSLDWIEVNSFPVYCEPQEIFTRNIDGAFQGIHSEFIMLASLKDSPQVIYMIVDP